MAFTIRPMKMHQIRDFIAVANTGSLRSAARSLNLAQPTLSKSIRQLEEDLGAVLINRSAKGVSLTPSGAAFLVRAELAWHELDRGKNEVNQLSRSGRSTVAIGVSGAPSLIGLADAMRTFRKEMPDVYVRVTTGNFPSVLPELQAGTLDFSIGPRPTFGLGEAFLVSTILKETRVVVCSRKHPLRHAQSLRQLINADWVLTGATGQPMREYERFFSAHGLNAPTPVMQCEYVTALLALLAGNDLLALLPDQWVDSGVTNGLLQKVPIQERATETEICLVHRSASSLTPAARHLLKLLKREFEYHRNRNP